MNPTILDLKMQAWTTHPVSGLAVTRNVGTAGGWVQLGDGSTPATYPTQLGRAQTVNGGMSFNGITQRLEWLGPLPSRTYSVSLLIRRTLVGVKYLFDARFGTGVGYILDNSGTLLSPDGTFYVDGVASTSLTYGLLQHVVCSGMTLAATDKLVFGSYFGIGNSFQGDMFGCQVFPGTLTPTQLRDVRDRLMARTWGP